MSMEKLNLQGTITALATPFKSDLSIDFDAFKKLLDFQIENDVEGVVICGSTGEAATMTAKEKVALISQGVEHVAGRMKVIAGTGSNDTQASIELSTIAKELGVHAVLLVAPYYLKPSQEGLYHHFGAIAENVDIPQIIYNVPSRACVNITAPTQLNIARDFKNVIATKEASGDLEQMMEIIQGAPEGFNLLCGDDALTLPAIMMGAKGIISVLSNYAPKRFSDLVRLALKGDYEGAKVLHYELFELMQINFIETNPVPVKAALAIMGLLEENYRLPLTPIGAANRKAIEKALKSAKIIKKK